MRIETIKTGTTLVSSAVPDRTTHKNPLAYTRVFQSKKSRISVPVKCFYVAAGGHHILVDAGWCKAVAVNPIKHLGLGLNYASEPVMKEEEAAARYMHLQKKSGPVKEIPLDMGN